MYKTSSIPQFPTFSALIGPCHAAGLHDIITFSLILTMFYKPLAFIVGLSIIHALVLPPPIRLHQRQNNDCLPTATLKANCWKDIGVEDYLTRWNQSTPICEPYSGGYMVNSTSIGEQDCCEQGELWSTCFMRRRYNQSGPDCSTINPQRCVIDTNSKITWGNDAAAKFYVMRAIVSTSSPPSQAIWI